MKLLINEDITVQKSFADELLSESDVQNLLDAWAPLPTIFEQYAVFGSLTVAPSEIRIHVKAQKVTLTEEDMANVLYALGHVLQFKLRYSMLSSDSALVFELVDVAPSGFLAA